MKLLNRRGKPSYKEKRLIDQLLPFIEKEIAKDPNFINTWKPAENEEQLKFYVQKYCIEDAVIESETKPIENMSTDNTSGKTEEHTLANEKTTNLSETKTDLKDENREPFTDPWNDAEPTEREYVRSGDGFKTEGSADTGTIQDFAEPANAWDAYTIPDPTAQPGTNTANGQPNQQGAATATAKVVKEEPINPAFAAMSEAKKKKQTRVFAKGIVNVVCNALQFGYVWWVTKDINDAALFELEQKGIDLQILITLDAGQEKTIREFFKRECANAPINGRVTEEEREDLIDALADFLQEKGFAPSTGQSLLVTAGTIVARLGMSALQSKAQTASILHQLKALRDGDEEDVKEAMEREHESARTEKRESSQQSNQQESTAKTEHTTKENVNQNPDDLSDLGIQSSEINDNPENM